MIVIADTSVILNLCRIQHEHLLKQLFRSVIIPAQVAREFARLATTHSRFSGLALPTWIEVLPPTLIPVEVEEAELDPGESAAIALYLERKADALLIDESLGRKVAGKLGIRTIGIIRILVEARDQKLIHSVGELLDRLQTEANFWIAPELKLRVLQMAGE
jgi:predicted nucleic acid-binding protein